MGENRIVDDGTEVAPDDDGQTPSVLRLVNQAHRKLEHLLFNLESEADAQNSIVGVARELAFAVDTNSDVALACILLNQDEGSYAVRHCIDSAVVSLLVARALQKGQSETLTVMAAALTMNIGMLDQQEQLQSRLNAISGRELALIQGHPQQGATILKRAGIEDEDWLSSVLLHHENEDGSGYPFGKSGSDIPLTAKIVSLADRYCARVSSRSYRKPLLPNEALRDLLLADHKNVDPMLTACFISVLGTYPIGAVVRLVSGETGVVYGKGKSSNAPVVHVLAGPPGTTSTEPLHRDTGEAAYAIREMLSEEQAGIRFTMQQVWGEAAKP